MWKGDAEHRHDVSVRREKVPQRASEAGRGDEELWVGLEGRCPRPRYSSPLPPPPSGPWTWLLGSLAFRSDFGGAKSCNRQFRRPLCIGKLKIIMKFGLRK